MEENDKKWIEEALKAWENAVYSSFGVPPGVFMGVDFAKAEEKVASLEEVREQYIVHELAVAIAAITKEDRTAIINKAADAAQLTSYSTRTILSIWLDESKKFGSCDWRL